jgi:hypothetical protein
MDAVLTLESDEALQLAQQLAELTGEPLAVVVTRALAGQVAKERKRREAELLTAELLEIGRRCAAKLQGPLNSADHAELYGNDFPLTDIEPALKD